MAGKKLDLSKYKRPAALTATELRDKLAHLKQVLNRHKLKSILLAPEGAMRWLTGLRQQIIDIAPNAPSPVQALVAPKGSGATVTIITTPIEMPRVKDQIPAVFAGQKGVSVKFSTALPATGAGCLLPDQKSYAVVLGEIVRPLLGGLAGNQYKKLEWLAGMTGALLAEAAHRLEPGQNGGLIRGQLFESFARNGVESNLFLIALKGQETHLHPLYDERYKVSQGSWIKLVAGARYADQIMSETAMVRFGGGVTSTQAKYYRALQQGVVEYADCYRAGATEKQMYVELGRRFARIEKETGLKGFGKFAYLHHLGGPTSPIGNRDYIISQTGKGVMFPGMQFAINPVEGYGCTKVEIQGLVLPTGAPHLLDNSRFTPKSLQTYTQITAAGGTSGLIPDLIVR